MTLLSLSQEARFWANVDQSAGPDACWEWKASIDPNGYGSFGKINGKKFNSHRVALMLKLGYEPKGLACHSCDNRACCNPSHLHEGTYQTNMQECKDRGRTTKDHPCAANAKLSAIQVTEIRSMKKMGLSNRAIAERFKVAHTTIGNIARGIHWKHVS